MEGRDDMEDQDFIDQFEGCTLPAEVFDHSHHVKLAWLYLGRLPLLEAVARFSEGIRRYATANGKPERYHETITWAFLFLIHQRMRESADGHSWHEFAEANPDLLNWQENILKSYYREETLNSARAKRLFLLPDRLLPREPAD